MRRIVTVILFCALLLGVTACNTSGSSIESENNERNDTYLVLVNRTHELPEDWLDRIELVVAGNTLGYDVEIERETYDHFSELREDLLQDGIDIELDSVYRSVDEQKDLWKRFEDEKGTEYCEQYVAKPGYSEHHTGLAVDVYLIKNGEVIDDNDAMIAEKEIFAEVHSRLAEHGFILRYLENKEDITGYSYEPWHFRYVGVKAAKEIMEQGITLEEYLNEFAIG